MFAIKKMQFYPVLSKNTRSAMIHSLHPKSPLFTTLPNINPSILSNLGLNLRSGGIPYNPSEYYVFRNEQMYNGLTVVSWALTDMLPGQGGFCCIPGSHKNNYTCPPHLKFVADNTKCMMGAHQKSEDVVIFTETLTHGTLPWNADHPQLSILIKYSPGHSSCSRKQYPNSLHEQMESED